VGSQRTAGWSRSISSTRRDASMSIASAAVTSQISPAVPPAKARAPRTIAPASSTPSRAAMGVGPQTRRSGTAISTISIPSTRPSTIPMSAWTVSTSEAPRTKTTGAPRSTRKASMGISRHATSSPAISPDLSAPETALLMPTPPAPAA